MGGFYLSLPLTPSSTLDFFPVGEGNAVTRDGRLLKWEWRIGGRGCLELFQIFQAGLLPSASDPYTSWNPSSQELHSYMGHPALLSVAGLSVPHPRPRACQGPGQGRLDVPGR